MIREGRVSFRRRVPEDSARRHLEGATVTRSRADARDHALLRRRVGVPDELVGVVRGPLEAFRGSALPRWRPLLRLRRVSLLDSRRRPLSLSLSLSRVRSVCSLSRLAPSSLSNRAGERPARTRFLQPGVVPSRRQASFRLGPRARTSTSPKNASRQNKSGYWSLLGPAAVRSSKIPPTAASTCGHRDPISAVRALILAVLDRSRLREVRREIRTNERGFPPRQQVPASGAPPTLAATRRRPTRRRWPSPRRRPRRPRIYERGRSTPSRGVRLRGTSRRVQDSERRQNVAEAFRSAQR